MKKDKRLWDVYAFPGFSPSETVKGVFGDSQARIIALQREGKKRYVVSAVPPTIRFTIARHVWSAICPAAMYGFTWRWKSAASTVPSVAK